MANFSGEARPLGPGGVVVFNRSTSVITAVASIVLTLSIPTRAAAASRGIPEPVLSTVHQSLTGDRHELFGGQLFEKIIVTPRSKALGFVLSAAQFSVEVWNTWREAQQNLTAIVINGSGGLAVANPYGLPLIYFPLGSRIYQAVVPIAGPAQINQDLVFTFASAIGGADVLVTGSRITVFSIAPEWGEGISESIEYLTDVLKSYSDNEQRRALRQLARRALRFRSLTLNARDAAGMESLVWGWQNQPFGVPWWPDAQPLLSGIAAGVFVIPVDTADRQFVAGGLICVWVDEYTYEALTIVSVAAHTVTVSSPTQFAWSGGPGTRVLPVFLCRLPSSVDIQRFSSEIDQVDLQFIGEAQQPALAPSISPMQYLGFDVLELSPNWESTLKRSYKRSLVTIDPKVGPIAVIDKGGSAIVGQDFPWWIDGHANVTTFRAFILRRLGQLNPFWIPTWDQDLVLAADVGSADGGILIQSEFYSRFLFSSPARRFVAFIPIDGSGNVYRRITAAVDNGNGTETLTLDSATGKIFAKGATMISFLTLARLASDKVEIKWNSSEHAESVLSLQEVPRETP
jgi:hypothetical protein